jgi:hypothetical protein
MCHNQSRAGVPPATPAPGPPPPPATHSPSISAANFVPDVPYIYRAMMNTTKHLPGNDGGAASGSLASPGRRGQAREGPRTNRTMNRQQPGRLKKWKSSASAARRLSRRREVSSNLSLPFFTSFHVLSHPFTYFFSKTRLAASKRSADGLAASKRSADGFDDSPISRIFPHLPASSHQRGPQPGSRDRSNR